MANVTNEARIMSKKIVLFTSLFFLAFNILIKAHAQSNVPIDSPRGNYEGADNIHWYQQKNLRVDENQGLPPQSGDVVSCGKTDLKKNCFGAIQREPQESFLAQGRVPVDVAVFVDTRSTSGFDYPFRRAIDAIRRTNDAFSRSGVNAFIFVTEVRYLDFDARGYSYDASEIYERVYSYDQALVDLTARNDEADIVVFVRNAQGTQVAGDTFCGAASLGVNPPYDYLTPIVVLTCEDAESQRTFLNAPIVGPHEFGHVFGLAHESTAAYPLIPHLKFGRPYIDEAQNIATIMATAGERVPFFSSPLLFYRDLLLGDIDSADSVNALNQSATNVALYWELRWGWSMPESERSSTKIYGANPQQTQSAEPGSLIPPGVN